MKNLIYATILSTSLSILSAPVFAHVQAAGNDIVLNSARAIATEVTTTKEGAYKNGYEKLLTITSKSGVELKKQLNASMSTTSLEKSIHLDNISVTVTEFMAENGKIYFQGIVNAEYHYQDRVSSN